MELKIYLKKIFRRINGNSYFAKENFEEKIVVRITRFKRASL